MKFNILFLLSRHVWLYNPLFSFYIYLHLRNTKSRGGNKRAERSSKRAGGNYTPQFKSSWNTGVHSLWLNWCLKMEHQQVWFNQTWLLFCEMITKLVIVLWNRALILKWPDCPNHQKSIRVIFHCTCCMRKSSKPSINK